MKNSGLFSGVLLIACFITQPAIAQPSWQWAAGAGGPGYDLAKGVAVSPGGNVFITGSFYSDTISFGSTSHANWGLGDLYIAGYDPSGNSLWSLAAGSSEEEIGNDIATDSSGNIYVTGSFSSDAMTLGSSLLLNNDPVNGTADVFLAKMDAAGNVLWATSAGGNISDGAYSIACDGAGNIYITGEFTSPSITFGSYVLTNNNISNFFIAKYDPAGNVLWAHNNDLGYGWGLSIAADAVGNAYALGSFIDTTIVFGSNTIQNADGLGWTPDLFLVKFDMNGNVQWVNGIGGTDSDEDGSIATDLWGNVFVCGFYFSNTINIGGIVLNNGSAGGDDYFAAKFNTNGNVLWAKDADGYSEPYAIAVDAHGNCYVTGEFQVSVSFGADTLFQDTTGGNFLGDVFVVRYDANGNPTWQISADGNHYDEPWAITTDANRNVYIAGDFAGDTIDFGGNVLLNDTTDHTTDVFVCKLYGGCSAGFFIYPDSTQLHHYIAINTTSGLEPISYTWHWGDGTTDNTPYPTHTYADSGFYDICLEITDSLGCTSIFCDSSFHALHSNNTMVYITVLPEFTTGTNEYESPIQSLSVYPNPTTGIVTIHDNSFALDEKLSIHLYNVLDEKIFSANLSWKEKNQISISDLPSGIYFLRISSREKMQSVKVVKE